MANCRLGLCVRSFCSLIDVLVLFSLWQCRCFSKCPSEKEQPAWLSLGIDIRMFKRDLQVESTESLHIVNLHVLSNLSFLIWTFVRTKRLGMHHVASDWADSSGDSTCSSRSSFCILWQQGRCCCRCIRGHRCCPVWWRWNDNHLSVALHDIFRRIGTLFIVSKEGFVKPVARSTAFFPAGDSCKNLNRFCRGFKY